MAGELQNVVRERGHLDLAMDGTFKVVPRVGRAQQLFMVHLVYEHHVSVLYFIS